MDVEIVLGILRDPPSIQIQTRVGVSLKLTEDWQNIDDMAAMITKLQLENIITGRETERSRQRLMKRICRLVELESEAWSP